MPSLLSRLRGRGRDTHRIDLSAIGDPAHHCSTQLPFAAAAHEAMRARWAAVLHAFAITSISETCLFLFRPIEENAENRGLHIGFHWPYCWLVGVVFDYDLVDDSAEESKPVFWIKHQCCQKQITRSLDCVDGKDGVSLRCLAMWVRMHNIRSTCGKINQHNYQLIAHRRLL